MEYVAVKYPDVQIILIFDLFDLVLGKRIGGIFHIGRVDYDKVPIEPGNVFVFPRFGLRFSDFVCSVRVDDYGTDDDLAVGKNGCRIRRVPEERVSPCQSVLFKYAYQRVILIVVKRRRNVFDVEH